VAAHKKDQTKIFSNPHDGYKNAKVSAYFKNTKEWGHYCTNYSYPTVLIRNAANFVDLIFVSSIMIL
jgi:hypothetical protein